MEQEVNTKEILKGKIYTSATENIIDQFKLFDFKNKDILTVTSSADQALNALYLGANTVDTFDNNPNTEYYMRLKEASIKALGYYDFIETFFYNVTLNRRYNKEEERKVFEKISSYLNHEMICLWNELLNIDDVYSFTNLFSMLPPNIETARRCNYYIRKEEDYEKLRGILKEKSISFTLTNMFDLPKNISSHYDMIFLSNIINYVKDYKFYDFVFQETPNLLKNDGLTIWYNYAHYEENSNYFGEIMKYENIGEYIVANYYFESYFDYFKKDHISVYQKKRKKS